MSARGATRGSTRGPGRPAGRGGRGGRQGRRGPGRPRNETRLVLEPYLRIVANAEVDAGKFLKLKIQS